MAVVLINLQLYLSAGSSQNSYIIAINIGDCAYSSGCTISNGVKLNIVFAVHLVAYQHVLLQIGHSELIGIDLQIGYNAVLGQELVDNNDILIVCVLVLVRLGQNYAVQGIVANARIRGSILINNHYLNGSVGVSYGYSIVTNNRSPLVSSCTGNNLTLVGFVLYEYLGVSSQTSRRTTLGYLVGNRIVGCASDSSGIHADIIAVSDFFQNITGVVGGVGVQSAGKRLRLRYLIVTISALDICLGGLGSTIGQEQLSVEVVAVEVGSISSLQYQSQLIGRTVLAVAIEVEAVLNNSVLQGVARIRSVNVSVSLLVPVAVNLDGAVSLGACNLAGNLVSLYSNSVAGNGVILVGQDNVVVLSNLVVSVEIVAVNRSSGIIQSVYEVSLLSSQGINLSNGERVAYSVLVLLVVVVINEG